MKQIQFLWQLTELVSLQYTPMEGTGQTTSDNREIHTKDYFEKYTIIRKFQKKLANLEITECQKWTKKIENFWADQQEWNEISNTKSQNPGETVHAVNACLASMRA